MDKVMKGGLPAESSGFLGKREILTLDPHTDHRGQTDHVRAP